MASAWSGADAKGGKAAGRECGKEKLCNTVPEGLCAGSRDALCRRASFTPGRGAAFVVSGEIAPLDPRRLNATAARHRSTTLSEGESVLIPKVDCEPGLYGGGRNHRVIS